MSTAEVDAIGQGRVFTGRQALAAGLVDELGGLEDAIRIAAVEAGFPEGAATRIISLPEPPTLAEAIEAEFRSGGPARTFPASRCGASRHPPGDSSLRPRISRPGETRGASVASILLSNAFLAGA